MIRDSGRFSRSRRAIAILALFAVLSVVWVAEARPFDQAPPSDPDTAVYRVYFDDVRDLESLAAFDIWTVSQTDDRYAVVAMNASERDALDAAGWRIDYDQPLTDAAHAPRLRDLFFGEYRTVDELYADLDALNAAYPDISEIVTYGESECLAAGGCITPGGDELPGFPLRAIRITNEAIPGYSNLDQGVERGEKPVLFMIAAIHSREITTPELAMRFAGWLLEGYGQDPNATWLVDWHEVWIVPTANPDGHWLVELGTQPPYNRTPLSHRKNANMDADGDGELDCIFWPSSSAAQFGIDLNRNHSFGWGPPGSSTVPCDLTYRGLAPGSEREVAGLETLVSALIPDQRGEGLTEAAPDDTTGIFITVHSYSELVLWPWGGFYQPAPNRDGLKAIGDKLASFNGYWSCQPTECLYAANGASDDWAYGALGIPAFTFEVGTEFMPPYYEIDAYQWPENKPAWVYAARIARTPYLTVLGPDSQEATVVSETQTASVILDDSDTGNNTIAGAEYSIGKPFWDPAHVAKPLTAVDGAFDSPTETASASLDVSGVADGRHLVYFRGRDSEGNWGAVTAAFLEVGREVIRPAYLPYLSAP